MSKRAETISQEQAREYQEVAGLVCLDLDVLNEIAFDSDMTLDKLQKQVRHTHKMKEKLIADPETRRRRYGAAAFCLSFQVQKD